ncbi:MAG: ABC transporter ATP-binding protein [Rhodospirillaceae bacterium]
MSASDSQFALNLNLVEKTYRSGTVALAPTTLKIQHGEFVSLVGPSGCGKSTLLRLMSGLITPTSGHIDHQHHDQKKDVGFVFQEATLMPWANVYENVSLPLRLQESARNDHDRIETVLAWVGLEEFHQTYPRELSGGMKMRVSIARALVTEPTLLLLDEPFAALDEFTRAQLNEDLLRIWEDQKWTAVFVTHSIREAAFLSERVIVMSPRPGRVVADIDVPFAYPRNTGLRDQHNFTDFSASVSNYLGHAMAAET